MSILVLICLLDFFVTDGIPLLRRPCLPPRVPYFTGRQKECDEIIGHLFSESTRIVSICGSPGFGKTSVAVAVGHEVQSRGLPVFWLSLRGLRSKADLTSKLLSFFRQPSKNTFSSQHLSRDDELCQLFSEISDDLVFILDNADDLLESGLPKVNREEVVEFLEEILRRNQNVKFAITTRESFGFLNLHLEFHQSVRIRPLEEASSRSLVHELLPDASISDCKRITQICGHVPLAIKLLCSSISEDSAQPSQFLNELLVSSTESIVEMLDSPGYPTNHRLRFLFNSSFERLCKQEKEALVSFSVLPENFDTEVAASVLGKTVRLTKNILQSLERKSLLDSSLERRSFKMHKLLQLFARERGNDEMKEIFDDSKSRLHAYYLSLFERLNEQFLTGHSMSAFVAFYEDKQNIVQSLVDGCSYSETADRVFDVLDNAEIFLDSIFWTHSSATCPFDLIYDSALKAASRYGNTVYYGRLLVSKSFGQLMWGVKGRSLKLLREVDEIRQAATPCTRDEKAKYLCYFGMYHLVTREIESGVKCLQEALPLMSNSPEHRILRLVIFQIFALYWQVEKNRSHSRQFYGKALLESMAIGDIQLLVIPSSEMETANETKGRKIPNRCPDTLCNKPMEVQIIYHVLQASQHLPVIGTNKSLQDIVLKIRDDVEAALPCGETGLFSFHRVVVATLLNVFSKCKEKGNLPAHSQTSREQKQQEESGNSKHETAKEYYSASSGKNCKDPDNVKNKQCILVSSGALQSRQRATDIAIERFGAEHPNTADSYHTLGITQHLLGDFTSALRSLQKALNIRQVVLGNDHLGTADIYRSLGATHYQLGDFSAALQCRQQALDIRRKDLGEEHASLVEGYIELSCTQFALGDFSSAVESNKRALEVCIKMFGEEDPRTPCILLSLANTQRLLGDLTTALEYAECALCISVRLFGTENVITASGYCSLGDIHLSLENHAVARYYYQMAHNIDARLFGNEHVNTLRYTYLQLVQLVQFASIHHLKVNAINFILVSDLNAALQDALSALSLDVNLYGEEHVYTADSFYLLGSIQFQLFDFNSSLYCHERALDIKLKVLGEEHSGTVFSFMFLALVHFALGNFTTAKEYAECALSIRPRLSEEDIIANFFECCLLILAIEIVTVAFEQVDNALN